MAFRASARLLARSNFSVSAARPVPKSNRVFYRRSPLLIQQRNYVSHSSADEAIEEIQDQYATAKDEFEIAQEETEKMTVYAEDDRRAAREELDKLQAMYTEVVEQTKFGDEVKNRVGQRIRELDNAVKQMEELAMNQD